MLFDLLSNSVAVVSVLVFVAVLLLAEAGYLLWRSARGPAARKLNARMEAFAHAKVADRQSILRRGSFGDASPLERSLSSFGAARTLDAQIRQAGLSWTITGMLLASIALAAAGWMFLSALFPGTVFGILAAGVLFGLPLAVVRWKRSRRLSTLERQLPDALDLIARALRAGHAFSSSIKMGGEELPEPIAGELRVMHDEVTYGVSQQQALTNMADRIPLMDLRYFVVAVLIQRESGGNLAEILTSLSRLMRERFKLQAKVRVLSAESRLSGWVMGLLPFALAAVLNAFNPKFMSPLWTDPLGIQILQYVLPVMALGALLLRRITRIRV
ncbi:type II secretion system F family protein [Ramlibacter sp. AN1015]|uniref:type II secretion system F family protein n=1 Tax=Ramlibacter sp. AN1015 TaxID=3133428 RepID=UPI0030C5F23B